VPSHHALSPEVIARICAALDISASDLRVRPLSGGVSNRSYRLTSGSGDWAVRLPAKGCGDHGIDVRMEQCLLGRVNAAGLTPPVIASSPEDGFLITGYLDGATPWSAERARDLHNISRVCARLRALHQLEHKLEPLRPTLVAEAYRQAANAQRSLTKEETDWGRELGRLARSYEAGVSPTALCHNDLVAANILDDGQLWFIDFEYAVCAEPLLDLASLAGMNGYDSSERQHLVDAYYQGDTAPFTPQRLDDVIRLVQLLGYFWVLSRRRIAENAELFDRFAATMTAMLR